MNIKPASLSFLLFMMLCSGALLLATGCNSTKIGADDHESDLPWATQEPWEGTITMPGLDGN